MIEPDYVFQWIHDGYDGDFRCVLPLVSHARVTAFMLIFLRVLCFFKVRKQFLLLVFGVLFDLEIFFVPEAHRLINASLASEDDRAIGNAASNSRLIRVLATPQRSLRRVVVATSL